MTAAEQRLGGQITAALTNRSNRRWALAVAFAYLVVYLFAIRNVIVSFGADLSRFVEIPSVQVVPDWSSKVFKQIAAFYYEPVAALYPLNHVTILVSPVNIAMGLVLGALVGTNVALALHVVRRARSCRRRAFTGLLGALPGFLTGFACCVPTVALVLGAQFTVAIAALRSYFFPFAILALLLALWWNARRARDLVETGPIGPVSLSSGGPRPLSLRARSASGPRREPSLDRRV